MKESKVLMIKKAITILEGRYHLVDERANGHLKVNGMDFWATTGKWYDASTGKKGLGLRSFIEHLERRSV